ncbi:MAG: rhomboid family intramembrane serine protease [Thermoleophilia bacterium]|nr:rhomboid family intramembrane serine protease [Thermoleophilia bacterium]
MKDVPHCYRHPGRETRVSCAECARPICEECMTFAPVGIKCPDHAAIGIPRTAAQPRRRQVVPVSETRPAATIALVAVNVGVFLLTVAMGGGLANPGGEVFERGTLVGLLVWDGEWWRLGTSVFLHAGMIHLAFNMLALWWLGSVVEQWVGSGRFLLVYLAAGLSGSAGALLFTDPFAQTVGASGAIFGTMGALLVLEYFATGSLAGQAMGLLAVNLVITFAIPNISKGGHLGGLVGGIVATCAVARLRGRLAPLGLALAAGVAVVAVAVAWWRVRSYSA